MQWITTDFPLQSSSSECINRIEAILKQINDLWHQEWIAFHITLLNCPLLSPPNRSFIDKMCSGDLVCRLKECATLGKTELWILFVRQGMACNNLMNYRSLLVVKERKHLSISFIFSNSEMFRWISIKSISHLLSYDYQYVLEPQWATKI